jgi:hypothetical protein
MQKEGMYVSSQANMVSLKDPILKRSKQKCSTPDLNHELYNSISKLVLEKDLMTTPLDGVKIRRPKPSSRP